MEKTKVGSESLCSEFVDCCLKKCDGALIDATVLYNTFKAWWRQFVGRHVPKQEDFHAQMAALLNTQKNTGNKFYCDVAFVHPNSGWRKLPDQKVADQRIHRLVDDPKIDFIDAALSLPEIEDAFLYASEKYKKKHNLLKELDRQFNAMTAGMNENDIIPEPAWKKHLEFKEVHKAVLHYERQADRFIRLWGNRIGAPVFLTDKNGLYVQMPNGGDQVGIGKRSLAEIKELL